LASPRRRRCRRGTRTRSRKSADHVRVVVPAARITHASLEPALPHSSRSTVVHVSPARTMVTTLRAAPAPRLRVRALPLRSVRLAVLVVERLALAQSASGSRQSADHVRVVVPAAGITHASLEPALPLSSRSTVVHVSPARALVTTLRAAPVPRLRVRALPLRAVRLAVLVVERLASPRRRRCRRGTRTRSRKSADHVRVVVPAARITHASLEPALPHSSRSTVVHVSPARTMVTTLRAAPAPRLRVRALPLRSVRLAVLVVERLAIPRRRRCRRGTRTCRAGAAVAPAVRTGEPARAELRRVRQGRVAVNGRGLQRRV